MRIVCVLVLTCAFPFIALSQIQPDKAILADYAHPVFVQVLQSSEQKIIIHPAHQVYLAAANSYQVFQQQTNFTLLRQLTPLHAIIRIDLNSFTKSNGLFTYLLPANNSWKLSPSLLDALKSGAQSLRLMVSVKNIALFKSSFSQQLTVLNEYRSVNILVVQLKNRSDIETVLASEEVFFADLANRNPKEELLVSGFDLGTNRVNTLHHHFPNVHGEGMVASVKENLFDTSDIDLKGRVTNSGFASFAGSGHATIMATMLGGAGNSFYEGKGVAWKTNLQSVSFSNLLPEPDSYYISQKIAVQNHSYGTGIENFYGADASAYDATVVNNPALIHVFSAGNSGLAVSNGPYNGIAGFANLTGSFKMAKNILVVGAIDSVGNIEQLSSRGPSYDGRIKPELVAFGQDGSSGAAAIVSGIGLLLQHAYKQQHHDSLPAAALVKAMLINTADDVGIKGPDFTSGYGNANAYRAIRSLRQSEFFYNNIQQANTQSFNLSLPAGLRSLKLTLAWTDAAAQANSARALVNDLDLELVHVSSGQSWLPWILSRFPHKDSLQLQAIRGIDSLNNVEQITLDAPPAGDYIIYVRGRRINNSQQYFIAYAADTLNRFEWMYPMSADPVEAGSSVMLRWSSGFNSATAAQLQYSLDNINWQTISNNVDLSRNYFRWNTPDTFATSLVRMIVGSNIYSTDTFVLSRRIVTQVGFNCADSFLFFWNRPAGVNSFRVYQRGSKFLEPLGITSDTFYIASKNAVNSRQFTIAPIINNKEGIKAYAFDYALQGVDCYFKSFLAQLIVDQAALQLQLGSVYRLKKIVVQKRIGNTFTDLQVINDPLTLQFIFNDVNLNQGANTYRIALVLADGRTIYSNTEVIYYLGNTQYLIFPNPVRAAGNFRILQKEPVSIRVLIYDATGRLMKDEMYADISNAINTASLQKGLYVIIIEREGKREFRGKLIVQ